MECEIDDDCEKLQRRSDYTVAGPICDNRISGGTFTCEPRRDNGEQ